ncbi:MAG: AbrB/MazE/SpoVT family DNA-binding domain-containing protein [Candidatus Eisenbacteria sp.]|nr:AbrB/MazE/SpoVT family DNA-binding domain-containing protein [Candidatus Eisenbacteria bacterium]
MPEPATTKMSSKGQVVIPEEVRRRLGLKPGVQFVVVADRDVVILKALTAPSMAEFDDLLSVAQSQARRAKMKRSDIAKATKRVRNRR